MSVASDRVRERWSGEALSVRDGRVDLGTIPPHGCRVITGELPPSGEKTPAT